MLEEIQYTDPQGVKWYKYGAEYATSDGRVWTIDGVWATDDADAVARLAAIRKSLFLIGRLHKVVDMDSLEVLAESGVPTNVGGTFH